MLSLHGLLPGYSLLTRENACLDYVMLHLDLRLNTAIVAFINATITDHDPILLGLSNISTLKATKSPKLLLTMMKPSFKL